VEAFPDEYCSFLGAFFTNLCLNALGVNLVHTNLLVQSYHSTAATTELNVYKDCMGESPDYVTHSFSKHNTESIIKQELEDCIMGFQGTGG
jgi:hypothetical protein